MTRVRRAVDGVLLLDKPAGLTSNAALQRVKRLFQAEKAGHTGTLDPFATGLLPIAFGEATKLAGLLLEADKSYTARVHLGTRTATGDPEGEVIETRPVDVTPAGLAVAVARFKGTISQVPPMHSALKRDGRPLYAYARAGQTVTRQSRQVTIHEISPGPLEGKEFDLRIRCSRGTYVRTLAEDIGEALGCGAHLRGLRRVGIGPFRIDEACTLEGLERLPVDARDGLLRPPDALGFALPAVVLPPTEAVAFSNGRKVCSPRAPRGLCRVYAGDGPRFLGLGEADERGLIAPRRLVARPQDAAPQRRAGQPCEGL